MRRTAIIGFVGGCLLLVAVGPATTSASTSTRAKLYWRAHDVTLPANAATGENQDIEISSISCASAGNCSAVGSDTDKSGQPDGLLLAETAGRWHAGVEAALPANAHTSSGWGVGLVSCASAGNCSAVGGYIDSARRDREVLLTETAGRWSRGVEAVLPADARYGIVESISCGAAGNCSAVGEYGDSAGGSQGLLLTEKAGKWRRGIKASLPLNANPVGDGGLTAVSCSSAGNCSAIGRYTDRARGDQSLLLTETRGKWGRGVEARLPANAIGSPPLTSVSCASPGNCAAVGNYDTDNTDYGDGVLLTETAGHWATGVRAVLPSDSEPAWSPDHQVFLNSVSCPSAGNCVAVGSYTVDGPTGGYEQGVMLSERSGTWQKGVANPLPADANPGSEGEGSALYQVSCASRGNCTAGGYYVASSGSLPPNGPGLLVTETAGRWERGIGASGVVTGVSCPSALKCGAVVSRNLLLDSHPARCVVPKVTGKNLRGAKRSIQSHECSVGKIEYARSRTITKGRVISQRPKPGRRLHHGAKVNLTVSQGP